MAMTEEKLREVIEELRRRVEALEPEDMSSLFADRRRHLLTMPDKMLGFLAEGRREKLMRWIGFMQGALWLWGTDLEDLKRMNMPTEDKG